MRPSYHSLLSTATVLCCLLGCTPPSRVTRFDGKTMGTAYQVTYRSTSGSPEQEKLAVENLLIEINQSLSNYIPTSLISLLNASTDTGEWHAVDRHFALVFRRAQEIHEDTDGAFNPALGPLIDAWGFGPSGPQPKPGADVIRKLLHMTSFDRFHLRDNPPAVRKDSGGAALDLGGIAKGYGVDAVASQLEQWGVKDYTVQIAGEVRTRGQHPDGHAWRIGIEKPADDALDARKIQTVVSFSGAALSTSGNYRNYTLENEKKLGHILDPKTGHPAESALLSASVLASDSMSADAYATALIVMGLDEAMRFLEKHQELQGYLIAAGPDRNLIEWRTAGFPESLED